MSGFDFFEIFFEGSDEYASHVDRSRAEQDILVAFGEVARGAMLGSREDAGELFSIFIPSQQVYHRLGLVFFPVECVVERPEQFLGVVGFFGLD